MRISKIFKMSFIGLMTFSATSCKKDSYKIVEQVPFNISSKVDLLRHKTSGIIKDASYKCYGYDTLEISKDFYSNQKKYIEYLNKQAQKKTPKTKRGKHLENQMIPKTGGGFELIPVWKSDYKNDYIEQKAVIKSKNIFTTNGNDLYIPVEYYGIPNK